MFQKITAKLTGDECDYQQHFHGLLLFFIWVLQLTGASMGLTDDRLGKMIFLVSFLLHVGFYAQNNVFKNMDNMMNGLQNSFISGAIAVFWAINYPSTDNWQTMFVVVTMFVSFLMFFFNFAKSVKG